MDFTFRKISIRGFTFLEVMLVVLIVSLLFAVALPNLRPASEKQKLNQAVRRVIAMCRFARAQAVSQHQYTYLDFDLVNQAVYYGTEAQDRETQSRSRRNRRNDWRDGERPDVAEDADVSEYQFPENVRVAELRVYEELFYQNGERARIYFYKDGKASWATIIMAGERLSRDGEGDVKITYYTVELFQATGMVSSERGYPEDEDPVDLNFEALAGRRGKGASFSYLLEPAEDK